MVGIKTALRLCELSYDQWFTHPLYKIVKKIETDSGIDAFVVQKVGAYTRGLVIRGSDEKIDWKNNFNVLSRRFRGFHCHKGFAKLAEELHELTKGYKLSFITGHSLGGAIAELMALTNPEAKSIVTFGAPGTRKFYSRKIARVEEVVTRFALVKDVVPSVPLTCRSDARTIWLGGKMTWLRRLLTLGRMFGGEKPIFRYHGLSRYDEILSKEYW